MHHYLVALKATAIFEFLKKLSLKKRPFASLKTKTETTSIDNRISRIRNIGISAHIDAGKTTLTERILFYTGRIERMHEVKGKDGVGARMDSMELERERGITIQSAATHCTWRNHYFNIIDTPGHVDFTVEVERALRVLDAAVLVLCAVAGVQSQTRTVDGQMKRHDIPRIAFINKLDRAGAAPFAAVEAMRRSLQLNAASLHVPVFESSGGDGATLRGIVDVLHEKYFMFEGTWGERVTMHEAIPQNVAECVLATRIALEGAVADVDDEVAEYFLAERRVPMDVLGAAMRKATIARRFVPVLMGAAYRNVGVQLLLDAVVDFLPAPHEVTNLAYAPSDAAVRVPLKSDAEAPLVALAFKVVEGGRGCGGGQLTFVRIYQGTLRLGAPFVNVRTRRRSKASRVVRLHAAALEDVEALRAGDVGAIIGVECASGDTFCDGNDGGGAESALCMPPHPVPPPALSVALTPIGARGSQHFVRALSRFSREDPTLRVAYDAATDETIVSAMGELHVDVVVERLRREFGCECRVGAPRVTYRETIDAAAAARIPFDYTHKRQSGGAGQFARVIGFLERLPGDAAASAENEFVSRVVGGAVPSCFVPAVERGFRDAVACGAAAGHPTVGVRYVLLDGAAHCVDSSEFAFRTAAAGSVREALAAAAIVLLEPLMRVVVTLPVASHGAVVASLTRRRASIVDCDAAATASEDCCISADAPLAQMFGYSTELRSLTRGAGTFTMEYKSHVPVLPATQKALEEAYAKVRYSK